MCECGRGGGGVTMVTMTSREVSALTGSFCLAGGESKQQSLDNRRRRFMKCKWQRCGSCVDDQGNVVPAAVCITPAWAAADASYINMLITEWLSGGELHVPVSSVIFN